MRGVLSVAGAALGLAAVAPQARLYGAESIDRYLRQHGRSRQVGNSIADQPHEHKREIARRLRQAERVRENRKARYVAAWSDCYGVYRGVPKLETLAIGRTRSGRDINL